MEDNFMIVDTHAHFGISANKVQEKTASAKSARGNDLMKEMQKLKKRVGYSKSVLEEDNLLEDYMRVMEANHIQTAWVHQLSFCNDLGYDILSNEDIAAAVQKFPDKLRGFASVNPYGKDPVHELKEAIHNLKLHGFKLNPNDYGGFWLNDKEHLYPLYEECCKENIPVSIHTGITPGQFYYMKHNNPILVDDVAVDFPELTIIVEHMGHPWEDICFDMVQRHQNMYVTITAVANIMIHQNPKIFLEKFNTMVAMLGSEKILWGSDWTATPNISEVLSFIKKASVPFFIQKMKGVLPITMEDKKNILGNNALRIIK